MDRMLVRILMLFTAADGATVRENRSRGRQLGDVCPLECRHEPIRSEQVISPPAQCLRRLSEPIEEAPGIIHGLEPSRDRQTWRRCQLQPSEPS